MYVHTVHVNLPVYFCVHLGQDGHKRKKEGEEDCGTNVDGAVCCSGKNEQSTGLRYEINTTFKHLRGIEAFLL